MTSDLTEVRTEDAFDLSKVQSWLQSELPDLRTIPQVQQFRSGASNLTYLLSYPGRDLVLRTSPHGVNTAGAHDMAREYAIQQLIKPYFPYAPHVLALCMDPTIIGKTFYVMERIPGTIFRREIPAQYLTRSKFVSTVGESAVKGLVELHSVDTAVLSDFSKGSGYVSRQISGWSKRYRAARTPDVPDAESLIRWLDENQPTDVDACLIHGDWRLDNMVFDVTGDPTLVGVLDWEMATVGDPLMDLGSALAYWVDADDDPEFSALRRQPSNYLAMPSRKEFVARYLELSGRKCSDFTFYEVFGLFRLTVIIQQIWARYLKGLTSDPHFADFGKSVNLLVNRAMARIS